MTRSESVPIGHTVEQYTLPKRMESRSHTNVVPAVMDKADRIICDFSAIAATGCALAPIHTAPMEAARKNMARNIRMILSCFMAVGYEVSGVCFPASAAREAFAAADVAFPQALP